MRRGFRLALEIRFRQSKGFQLAHLVGIDLRSAAAAATPFGFAFFDLFLDARFRVDEAFSGITHKYCGFHNGARWKHPVGRNLPEGPDTDVEHRGTRATSAAGPSLHCDRIRREGQRNY